MSALTTQQAQGNFGLSDKNPFLQEIADASKTFSGGGISGGAFGLGNPQNTNYYAAINKAKNWEQDQTNAANTAKANATQAPPQIDPRLQSLYDQQVKLATDFNQNIPQLENSFEAQAAQAQKMTLAKSIQNVNENYNARGMLYSTGRQGAVSSEQQKAAGALQNETVQQNQKIQDTGTQLNNQALNTGLNIAGIGQRVAGESTDLQNTYLNLALGNQAAQNKVIGDVASGLGAAVGTGAAAATNNTNSNISGYGSAPGGYSGANLNVNTNVVPGTY